MMNYLNEIKAISYFSSSLSKMSSIDEVLWDITKNVIHKLGFVDCVIYEHDSNKNILIQRAAYGQKNPQDTIIYNQIVIKDYSGIVGGVAKSKIAEIVSDTSKDSRYIIDDLKRSSELCVPILINGKLFGVIDSEHPEKNFFTENHLHLLTIIAALCAQRIKELNNQSKKILSASNKYFKKLEELMKFKKLYRNPNLNLALAANQLGISACYLSNIINSVLEISFTDYINNYRIKDIKNYLHSQHYVHYSILSLGLEAGFNSKSTFYNSFKKYVGMSPSEYRDKSLVLS